jgi:hypothetical protein
MSTTEFPGRPIVIGYPWSLDITVTGGGAVFPSGCQLESHVRRRITDETPLTELTTGNGGLTRIDDDTVRVRIDDAATSTFATGTVVFDIARTDGADPQYLGFRVTVPVVTSVTRP